MPRKNRKKDPSSEPTPIGSVLEQSPVAEMLANSEPEPRHDEPQSREHDAALTTSDQLSPPAPSLEEAARRLGVWAYPDPEPELVLPEAIEKAGLITADQLPIPEPNRDRAHLPDADHDGKPHPTAEAAVAEALMESQGRPRSFAQRVSEPRGLRPAPKGFQGLEGHYEAGIRLNRSIDKNVVGIQFADDRKPSRDGLNAENERLRERGFLYAPMRSQWERVDREQPSENYQDAKAFVDLLVKERLSKPRGEREL